MTKKDYIKLAAAIKQASEDSPSAEENRGIRFAAEAIADVLKADNSAFDRLRFLEACGLAMYYKPVRMSHIECMASPIDKHVSDGYGFCKYCGKAQSIGWR